MLWALLRYIVKIISYKSLDMWENATDEYRVKLFLIGKGDPSLWNMCLYYVINCVVLLPRYTFYCPCCYTNFKLIYVLVSNVLCSIIHLFAQCTTNNWYNKAYRNIRIIIAKDNIIVYQPMTNFLYIGSCIASLNKIELELKNIITIIDQTTNTVGSNTLYTHKDISFL